MRTARVVRDFLGESATYLGLAPKDLLAKLPGTSLGKIADSTPGKGKAGLVTALSVAANGDITKALSEKKITDDQANKMRAGLAEEINTFVDRTWPTKPAVAPRAGVPNVKSFLGDMLQTARDYRGGATLQEVTTAMRSGKSLGDIANEKGKGRDGLVAALTLAANTRIDKAVADNKLTVDQATTLKAKVTRRLRASWIASTRRRARPRKGRRQRRRSANASGIHSVAGRNASLHVPLDVTAGESGAEAD